MEQRVAAEPDTLADMQFTQLKVLVFVAWLLAVGVLAVFSPVTTPTGWFTIVGFGLLPSVFMLRAWREPRLSLSQSIQAETGTQRRR